VTTLLSEMVDTQCIISCGYYMASTQPCTVDCNSVRTLRIASAQR